MNRLRSFAWSIRGWCKYEPAWMVVARVQRGLWNLLVFPFRKKVAPEIREARHAKCKACVIYDTDHDTCGDMVNGETFVDPEDGRRKPLGCGCRMDMKSELPDANCWLWEKGELGGWPDKLNGGYRD